MRGTSMQVRIRGGKNIEAILKRLKTVQPGFLSYGFYAKSTYSNHLPVAQVAAWNEFGTERTPERPFFRHANKQLESNISNIFKGMALQKGAKVVSTQQLHQFGTIAVNTLKQSIVGSGITYVPNAVSTVKAKKSTKPLVDTGRLFTSPSYQIGRIGQWLI